MQKINSTTPNTITQEIRLFLASANLSERPRYLRFTNVSPDYLPKFFLDNTEKESQTRGAEIQYGWAIWEDKGLRFIEAEFHAVIVDKEKLVDITPRVDCEERILFVPDNENKAVRLRSDRWSTWTNIKSINGTIVEPKRSIHIHVMT